MIVLLTGVSGSGKTTVGTLLANAVGCPFLEGDELHPARNIDEMRRGVPLTDADRWPWLAAIRARLVAAHERGEDLVVACSALKHLYRCALAEGVPVVWVYLHGQVDLLRSRLRQRQGHFMKADMLSGQLADLEEPSDALHLDVTDPPEALVARILAELRARAGSVPTKAAGPDVRVFDSLDELSRRAAELSVETIVAAVGARGRCSIALSGGSTPRALHALLASDFRDRIPWKDVHVFWGDERYVPPDDDASNYRMARATLLERVPCPADHVHPMPTHFASPDAAAADYQETMRAYFGSERPVFDLVYLGIGRDGHTASLFPGLPAIDELVRWVVAVDASAEPPQRITLTLPVLLRAENVHVLVAGAAKRDALHAVLTRPPDPSRWPAAALRCGRGTVIWWVDRAAASPRLLPGLNHP